MRYNQKFKEKVIEAFKEEPYYKTIALRYDIERETLKRWLKRAKINVKKLKEGKGEKKTHNEKLIQKEMYMVVRIGN